MDWKTFFVRLVEAVTWPAVVAFIFWYTRDRIASLFTRLTKLKWKDAEATFTEKLDRAEEALTSQPPKDAVAPAVHFHMETIKLAEAAPRFAIHKAWMDIEKALLEVATKKNLVGQISPSMSGHLRVALLANRLGLPDDEVRTLMDLWALRNNALHDDGTQPTPTDALRYREIADRLMQDIKKRAE